MKIMKCENCIYKLDLRILGKGDQCMHPEYQIINLNKVKYPLLSQTPEKCNYNSKSITYNL